MNVETSSGQTGQFPRGGLPDPLEEGCSHEVDAAAAGEGRCIFFHNNPWRQSTHEPMRYDLAGRVSRQYPGIRRRFE